MKRVLLLLVFIILSFSLFADDKVLLSNLFLNKNVEVHYSLGGSLQGIRLFGTITTILETGIILEVANVGIYFINMNNIATIKLIRN